MSEPLAWALHNARQQTLALVADLREEHRCRQAAPGEHHPAWILGHILLGDTYLLSLLGVEAIAPDFPALLGTYGPEAPPVQASAAYGPLSVVVDRLSRTGRVRHEAVLRMSVEDLSRPTPDEVLARSQPTIGHHLHALLFHEGYHGGQLAVWRRGQGLTPVRWVLAPEESD